MKRKLSWGLVAAVLVYVGLRWLILFTAFDQTAMTMYELYPMGTLPKVLLEGGRIPLDFYYDNAAGQILTGLVALPYYLLFGETYLALKLVPATFGLGALVLVWVFLSSNFSRTATGSDEAPVKPPRTELMSAPLSGTSAIAPIDVGTPPASVTL